MSITLEIFADNTLRWFLLTTGGTNIIHLKNASEYGIQLKHPAGSMGLGPGAVSDTFTFHGGQGIARNWIGQLELKRVTDANGKNVPHYNLNKVVVHNKMHCHLFCIPLW